MNLLGKLLSADPFCAKIRGLSQARFRAVELEKGACDEEALGCSDFVFLHDGAFGVPASRYRAVLRLRLPVFHGEQEPAAACGCQDHGASCARCCSCCGGRDCACAEIAGQRRDYKSSGKCRCRFDDRRAATTEHLGAAHALLEDQRLSSASNYAVAACPSSST
jgi:hypothetical protein